MNQVRKLVGGLKLVIDPEVPIRDKSWIAHASVDGKDVSSGGGDGVLNQDALRVLKLLTDCIPGSLCKDEDILRQVWPTDPDAKGKLRTAILHLRDIGLKNLEYEERRNIISNKRAAGYYYNGTLDRYMAGSITGSAYTDSNKNGVLNNAESGLSGIALKLTDCSDNPVAATTTGAGGAYQFNNLLAGCYKVFSPATANGASLETASPLTVNLTAGQSSTGNNFGYATGLIETKLRSKRPNVRLLALGAALLLLGTVVGYLVKPFLIRYHNAPWQMVFQGSLPEDPLKRWEWLDISFDGSDGWVSGGQVYGGGGYVGKGMLLHTTDSGASWSRVDKFQVGDGKFEFENATGPNAYEWKYDNFGPIWTLDSHRQNLPGAKHELWLATETGVFRSENDGASWQRSTPRPDGPGRPRYAKVANILRIGEPEDIFSAGWQGISHWSSKDQNWQVKFSTDEKNMISSISTYPTCPGCPGDLWAVGHAKFGDPDSYEMVYHSEDSGATWTPMNVTGIKQEAGARILKDIIMINETTAFAVGPGAIVQGSKDEAGNWSWSGVKNPPAYPCPGADLRSIAYDNDNNAGPGTLWIVGGCGTVLRSTNRGQYWKVSQLHDKHGLASLNRVRIFGGTRWIVGTEVVYKYPKPGS